MALLLLGSVGRVPVGLAQGVSADSDERLDPVGAWNCLSYGDTRSGQDQLLLNLAADGSAAAARPRASGVRAWLPVGEWSVRRDRFRLFHQGQTREFLADLGQSTLGGTWRTILGEGGWWCVRAGDAVSISSPTTQRTESNDLFPPLVSTVMATPSYPRRAIREAREGRAVICFLVSPNGDVIDPTAVELSDESFERSSLRAVSASRFRAWAPERGERPGCRTIDFALDAIY